MEIDQTIQGFHHIAIAASNFDRSIEFYTTGLGGRPFRRWGTAGDRATMIDFGNGNHVEIFERPNAEPIQGTMIHLAFRVVDCHAVHQRALAAGAKESRPPKPVDIPSDPVYSVIISFVLGPDGEEIELFQEA